MRSLNAIAEGRGQKLAQLALQWVLRDDRVTSAVIGASSRPSVSIQRFSIEYEGWWISSGVPSSRAIVAASCVRSGE